MKRIRRARQEETPRVQPADKGTSGSKLGIERKPRWRETSALAVEPVDTVSCAIL